MHVKRVVIDKANRLYKVPPDILAFSHTKKRSLIPNRPEIIDLASFRWPIQYTPDLAPKAAELSQASPKVIETLREALANWVFQQHRVKVSPEREIFIGGGIGTMVNAVAVAFIENGEVAFVPDLAVPVYTRAVIVSGGEPIGYAISSKNDWQPEFDRLNSRLTRVARILFLNSPHSPTGAVIPEKDLSALIQLAAKEHLLLVNDAAFQTIPERAAPSLIGTEGGIKVGLELYSFSYFFGLPFMPFGFAVGNREAISGMKAAASLTPAFIPAYYADIVLQYLRRPSATPHKTVRQQFQKNSVEASALCDALNLEISGSSNIPFIWARIQRRRNSLNAARLLLRRSRILIAPGSSFGEHGQGYLRFSLTASVEDYRNALARLKRSPFRLTGGDNE